VTEAKVCRALHCVLRAACMHLVHVGGAFTARVVFSFSHTCTHTRTPACTHKYTHKQIHTHTHMCVRTNKYTHTHTRTQTHTHMRTQERLRHARRRRSWRGWPKCRAGLSRWAAGSLWPRGAEASTFKWLKRHYHGASAGVIGP